LKKNIFPDAKKFNISFNFIKGCSPTGNTNDQQVINLAAAMHCGKTKRLDYLFVNDMPTYWDNYGAWQCLSKIPKFAPTQSIHRADDDDDDDVVALASFSSLSSESAGTAVITSHSESFSAGRSTDTTAAPTTLVTSTDGANDAFVDENNTWRNTSSMVGRPSRSAGRVTGKKKALAQGSSRDTKGVDRHDEMKKIRLAIETRTELFHQSAQQAEQIQKQQHHLGKMLELKTLISVYETVNPEIADKARAMMLELSTASLMPSASLIPPTPRMAGGSNIANIARMASFDCSGTPNTAIVAPANSVTRSTSTFGGHDITRAASFDCSGTPNVAMAAPLNNVDHSASTSGLDIARAASFNCSGTPNMAMAAPPNNVDHSASTFGLDIAHAASFNCSGTPNVAMAAPRNNVARKAPPPSNANGGTDFLY
jgi:hypothetical protein